MAEQPKAKNEHWAERADQAADGFRSLIAVLVGALIVFSTQNRGLEDDGLWITVPGLVALVLLGLSWVIQKAKALAQDNVGKKIRFSFYLRNELYDIVAFALFLFSATFFALEEYVCGPILAFIFPAIFIFGAILLNLGVKKEEKRHAELASEAHR